MSFTIQSRLEATDYGCGPVETANPVVLADDAFGGQGGGYQYALLSDRVAEGRYSDGVRIEPISDVRLPGWVRAAIRVYTPREAARAGRRLFPPAEFLDTEGDRLQTPVISSADSVEHFPLTTLDPDHPASLPCTIHARSITGLRGLSQTVTAPVQNG